MSKKRIAVLFGGVSSEHDISRISASNVVSNLSSEKYEIYKIGITKEGKWFLFNGTPSEIADGSWEDNPDNSPAFISPDSSLKSLVVLKDEKTQLIKLDLVFPVLHGKNGEDGTMQGLLQLADIPFVGCDTLSSACCMDKAVTNILLDSFDIAQANYIWFYTSDYIKNKNQILDQIQENLGGYPVFIKPANAGSSVGVSKVDNAEGLDKAIQIAEKEDKKIVIEEGIIGQEVECAVMGNDTPIASVVGEIASCNDFYDFEAKYKNAQSKTIIPALLTPQKQEEIRTSAINAYRKMGCEGLARVDFFVRSSDGKILLNEINTLPGFTPISMYSKMFEASGFPYTKLLDELINYAFERSDK